MKNSIMPILKTKLMRRNGSAWALTSGAALTRSSRGRGGEIPERGHQERKHRDGREKRLINSLVDLVGLPGTDKTRHQDGLTGEQRGHEHDDDQEDLPADADGGVGGVPDEVADQDVVHHALQPGHDVLEHGRPGQPPDGGPDWAFNQ
jgi:hypothetical protein